MRRIAKATGSVLAVLGIVLTTGAVTAVPASAAVSCSGTKTYDSSSGTLGLGELTIYYNSSDGGTNSACFYHRGASYGVAAETYVKIQRCVETSGEGQPCTPDRSSTPDTGIYKYYAGPKGVTGTANRCVAAIGWVFWHEEYAVIDSGRQGC
ncbi:hypothetical protein SAMN05421837_106280 [Amycolatopsis pretoriensis]|uniref:Subtilisin inhibitor-like n=1 Tax=Amycolatopsis pretoriensis TaxID=218821 RepID=A0A1H5R267_9PSEU|nr:hypothetical protein [Amycolatopsis pretoriensis]SEF32483.1 hypothetical protein SAMN05421837_106280 [Amycolatopsis pretoriensis]